jgi:hypothetical protein
MARPHGYRMSEESKAKTSRSLMGRRRKPETCKKISATMRKRILYRDLKAKYKGNREVLAWIESHKDELAITPDDGILSESEIMNGGQRDYELLDVYAAHNMDPEFYLLIREDMDNVY